MQCDHPGCNAPGTFGFRQPSRYQPQRGEKPLKRPLRACGAHREWAEQRWRDRFPDRQQGGEAAIPERDPAGAIRERSPDAGQGDLGL